MPRGPKKRGDPLSVPMVTQPASMYGTFFEAANIPELALAAKLSLQASADFDEIARLLNDASTNFLLASQALATATPGELAAWCREVSARAEAFLGAFESDSDRTDPAVSAARVLRGPAGFIEGHNLPLDPWPEVDSARKAVAALATRASLAAFDYEKRKGVKRQAPDIEISFYRQLGAIYQQAFGEEWSLSTSRDGRRVGGGVRFCKTVGEHVAARHVDASPRGEAADAALRRLRHANSSAERIRDARSGGLVRKR